MKLVDPARCLPQTLLWLPLSCDLPSVGTSVLSLHCRWWGDTWAGQQNIKEHAQDAPCPQPLQQGIKKPPPLPALKYCPLRTLQFRGQTSSTSWGWQKTQNVTNCWSWDIRSHWPMWENPAAEFCQMRFNKAAYFDRCPVEWKNSEISLESQSAKWFFYTTQSKKIIIIISVISIKLSNPQTAQILKIPGSG